MELKQRAISLLI